MRTAALIFLFLGDLVFIGIYKALFKIAQGPYWVHKRITDLIKKVANGLIQNYPGKDL